MNVTISLGKEMFIVEYDSERRDAVTLEQIHKAVREGWHPPNGTPLMDFIWNAALDAAAEICREDAALWDDDCSGGSCKETARVIEQRILALKKVGTQ